MRLSGILVAALLFGCDPAVISLPVQGSGGAGGGGGNDQIDAPASGDMTDAGAMDDGGNAAVPDGGDPNCDPPQVTQDTGHHNAGMDCGQCHFGQMQAAPIWTLAGTLYTQTNGGPPAVGATIRVHQAGGVVLRLTTAQNGNFYTNQPINFPITVEASSCPNTVAMQGNIAGVHVSCNNCHRAGVQGPMHLP
jgi:hypothetical protein